MQFSFIFFYFSLFIIASLFVLSPDCLFIISTFILQSYFFLLLFSHFSLTLIAVSFSSPSSLSCFLPSLPLFVSSPHFPLNFVTFKSASLLLMIPCWSSFFPFHHCCSCFGFLFRFHAILPSLNFSILIFFASLSLLLSFFFSFRPLPLFLFSIRI